LLEDLEDEDETERGRALVTSAAGWRTEMAKWIGEEREANNSDSDDDLPSAPTPRISGAHATAWSPCKLSVLFRGEVTQLPRRELLVFDKEAALMEELADQQEDEYPDDGAMEGSGDDYE
jgi:hypothetical protein